MTDWLKRKWCEWMHDAPMQPIRGKWICRVCQVEHPVMWDEPERGSGVLEASECL